MEEQPRNPYTKPDGLGNCHFASHDMGLSTLDPAFVQFTSTLRTLAPRFLNLTRRFREQNPERWTAFFKEALKQVPFLTDYEESWPIEGYMRRYLLRTRWEHKRGIRKHSMPNVRRMHPDGDDVGNRECEGLRRSMRQRMAPYRYQPRAVFSSASTSKEPSIRSGSLESMTSTRHSSPAAAPLGSESGLASDPADALLFEPCKEAVHAFLQGLQPSMETFMPKFMGAGLVNKHCLFALAGMPDREKDKLLRDDMSLSVFQMRVVRVGLAGLHPDV